MRDIKFRAWNDKLEEFCYAGPKESDFEGFGIFFDWVERWNLPLMQFTGLLDKAGKDIYEGDIIQWHNKCYGFWICGYVKYEKDNACYFVIDQHETKNYLWYGINEAQFEVIGNIYENKDLLDTK
uniref:Putative YopX protein n=1 Tax=viral metagenome TaxID=1070528 RepID=A0A6M3K6N9_9ZZZZ